MDEIVPVLAVDQTRGVPQQILHDHRPALWLEGQGPFAADDVGPTPEMGQGFGLGFAVRTAEGHNPLPGSIGNFYWTGAWGTTFWVDPKERLIAIQMIQTPANSGGPYRHAFRNLTYAALTGSEPAR